MQLSFTEKKNIRKNFGKLKESLSIPNLIDPRVPDGNSEADNVVVEEIGKKPTFNFEIKDHRVEMFGLCTEECSNCK